MPRRLILSATERDTLLALPESQDDLIRYYTFNDSDLSLIRQRRGDANRLGFAVQLCLLRYPGYALGTDSELPEPVILWVAKQVQAEPASWAKYGERDVTRREHAQELRTYLQLAPFGLSDFRALVRELTELAQQTDKGLLLAGQALESLRQKRRILPALSVIDRACSEAIARANRRVYRALVEPLRGHDVGQAADQRLDQQAVSHGLPFLGAEVRPKGVQAVMNGGGRVFGGQVDHRAGGQFAHLQQIRPACNLCGQLQGQHGFTGTTGRHQRPDRTGHHVGQNVVQRWRRCCERLQNIDRLMGSH